MAKKAKKQETAKNSQKFENEHVNIDEYKFIEFQYDVYRHCFNSCFKTFRFEFFSLKTTTVHWIQRSFKLNLR